MDLLSHKSLAEFYRRLGLFEAFGQLPKYLLTRIESQIAVALSL